MELNQVFVGIAAFLAIFYFHDLASSIKEATSAIKELNIKVGVIIERTEVHAHEIAFLREKQDNLQNDMAQIKAHITRKES